MVRAVALAVLVIGFLSAAEAAERVVTLAPSLAELAVDLFEGEVGPIVGVSEFSDVPSSLKGKPSVGPYHKIRIERVLQLKPTIVFATRDGNEKDQIERLRSLGLRVEVLDSASIADIANSIERMGAVLSLEKRARQLAQEFRAEVERLRSSAPRMRRRVMVQIGADPLVVVGGRGFLAEALELAGCQNVYGDLRSAYPRPSLEDVLKRGPEVIVVLSMGGDLLGFQKMAEDWKRFGSLLAVRRGAVRVLQADELVRPTRRLVIGIQKLKQHLMAEAKP